MTRITFVTGNRGKVEEMQGLLAPLGIEVGQDDRGYSEIQADTLEAVAEAGADALLQDGLAPPFLLEDAGLWIGALRGFPGIYSAYVHATLGGAGVLRLMQDLEPEMRQAAFQAHLLFVDDDGTRHGFSGTCTGRIAARAAGSGGFGYDPIFVPDGQTGTPRTFAQMDTAEKSALSHRGHAARAFAAWLQKRSAPAQEKGSRKPASH